MTNTEMLLGEPTLDQPSYLHVLTGLPHSSECLSSRGYITAQLLDADLERKRRCVKCNLCKMLPMQP